MAKRKPAPPETSKIERDRPLAYSRRQKGADGKDAEEPKPDDGEAQKTNPVAGEKPSEKPNPGEAPKGNPVEAASGAKAETSEGDAPKAAPEAKTGEMTAIDPTAEPPAIEPPAPKGEPWPDATPQPMRPVEAPARARSETVAMPAEAALGAPPALPGSVEAPTHMPGPRDVPGGNVTDPAAPPGRVPSGDSRSLRKGNEFALVYRQGTAVITRFGTVGQRGQWRVVEYPTPASASNSYAKEVSRYVGDGFTDYRE